MYDVNKYFDGDLRMQLYTQTHMTMLSAFRTTTFSTAMAMVLLMSVASCPA
jgi:hypothetical protein